MKRDFVCIVCPNGCDITAEIEGGRVLSLSGALCKRGQAYVEAEITRPMRTIATSVAVTGGTLPLVSVRLDAAIPKALIFDCMSAVRGVCLTAPVDVGDVVLRDVCSSGANFIATKNVPKI